MGRGWNHQLNTLQLGDAEMDELTMAAAPCDMRISKNSFKYKVSLRAPSGGYAVRAIHLYEGKLRDDAVQYIAELIHSMKKELGSSAMSAPPQQAAPQLEKKEFTGVVQLKPKNNLECPDHRNLLVPAEEGVLKCPVPGCKKRMRKKPKETPPTVVIQKGNVLGVDLKAEEVPIKNFVKGARWKGIHPSLVTMDEASALQAEYQKATEPILLDTLGLSEEQKQKVLEELGPAARKTKLEDGPPITTDHLGGHDEYGGLRANDRPVRVQYRNSRWYLLQLTDTGEVAIDVTTAYKEYNSFHSGFGGGEDLFRLHLEWKARPNTMS